MEHCWLHRGSGWWRPGVPKELEDPRHQWGAAFGFQSAEDHRHVSTWIRTGTSNGRSGG
jgi:hypothetical protein